MTITTTQPPEAEFEARIDATLERVFPGVTQLRHQSRFKLRVGRTVLEAGAANYVEGRAGGLLVFSAISDGTQS